MNRTALIAAALAAAAAITPAHAVVKRKISNIPTDKGLKKVLSYFDAVRGHYDADGDGTLSDTERAAWEAEVKAGQFPPPPPPCFPLPEQ